MQSKVKVSDRLSDDPEDNSYINNMSLTRARVWTRIRTRAIASAVSRETLDILMLTTWQVGSVLKVLTKLKNIYSFVGERALRGGAWIYLTRGGWTSGGE